MSLLRRGRVLLSTVRGGDLFGSSCSAAPPQRFACSQLAALEGMEDGSVTGLRLQGRRDVGGSLPCGDCGSRCMPLVRVGSLAESCAIGWLVWSGVAGGKTRRTEQGERPVRLVGETGLARESFLMVHHGGELQVLKTTVCRVAPGREIDHPMPLAACVLGRLSEA